MPRSVADRRYGARIGSQVLDNGVSGQAPAADERPEAMLGRERVALVLLAVAGACILPGALDRFVFPKLAVVAAAVALAATVAPRGRLPGAARVAAPGRRGSDR
jgi:hypothetical protein